MSTDNQNFLLEGIKRYEEACDTITAFEEEMKLRLRDCLGRRTNWAPLKNPKVGRASTPNTSAYGYWIAAEVLGKSSRGENAVIDCGFWWKSPKVVSPIIYAEFFKQPKAVANFLWDSTKSDIGSFTDWNRTYLYLPLNTPDTIEASLNKLLDALLLQLK